MASLPTIEDDAYSHDESSVEASGSETSFSKPTSFTRGGTVRGKSITGRMSKFEDTTTKSVQKLNVIGAPLHSLLEFDGQRRTLPLILKNCLDALRDDESISKSETLFRGNLIGNEELQKMEEEFSSPNLNVNLLRYSADATSLLLLDWMSKLPEPLLSESKMGKFEAAFAKYGTEDAKKRGKKLAQVVKSLPSTHSNILQYLINYLHELSLLSQTNRLTPACIASIFTSTLTRSTNSRQNSSSNPIESTSTANADHTAATLADRVIALLISDYPTIFADFSIEDKETIPEDQLADEVKAKRKSNFFRSNSVSMDKPSMSPARKTMVISSSSEHLTSPSNQDSPQHSQQTPTSASPGVTISGTATTTPPLDEQEKEEKKKGLKGTLRKLGFGKDKKDKSAAGRSRAQSVSTPTSPLVSRSSTPTTSPLASPAPAEAKPQSPTIFGMPFESLLQVEGGAARLLPNILVDCLKYLQEDTRAKEFGIFRESGSFNDKANFKKAYDSPAVRIDFDGSDGYTVAALTKEWLRALPECLLTTQLYQEFKEAVSDDLETDASNLKLKTAVSRLPESRRIALHFLLHFFKTTIVSRAEDNKMGVNNVGIVLGPCLHRKENPSPDELMDPCHNMIVVHMLRGFDEIFGEWTLPELPVDEAPGTIFKKASELDRATSVLEDINRKMATAQAEAAAAAAAATSGPVVKVEEETGMEQQTASSDSGKGKERKRKGSGIFEIWDRFKEEAAGSGRKRSSTMSNERAPFAERSPISRSSSGKQGSSVEHFSRAPVTRSTSVKHTTVESPFIVASPSASPSASDSPNARPIDVPSSVTPPPKTHGEVTRQSSGSGLNVRILTIAPSDTSPLTSPTDSPAMFGDVTPSGKRSKRNSRIRELSNSGIEFESRMVEYLSSLPAPLLEFWLSENSLGDLVPGLKNTTGKQLCAFSKADLRAEFGLRGVALWNTVHPNSTQEEVSLTNQVAKLTSRLEELLARMGMPLSPTPPPPAFRDVVQTSASPSPVIEQEVLLGQPSKRASLAEAMSAVLSANVVPVAPIAPLEPLQSFDEAHDSHADDSSEQPASSKSAIQEKPPTDEVTQPPVESSSTNQDILPVTDTPIIPTAEESTPVQRDSPSATEAGLANGSNPQVAVNNSDLPLNPTSHKEEVVPETQIAEPSGQTSHFGISITADDLNTPRESPIAEQDSPLKADESTLPQIQIVVATPR